MVYLVFSFEFVRFVEHAFIYDMKMFKLVPLS